MHLDLNNGPFVSHVKSWEPRNFTEVPDVPQACTINILRLRVEKTSLNHDIFTYTEDL